MRTTRAGAEPTAFLYPFIDNDELDAANLVTDLAASARAKIATSAELRRATTFDCADVVQRAAIDAARRFRAGGRLFAFGNGGSSTDADSAVGLFRSPPHGRPLAALSLVDDQAVLTAIANDVGYDLAFVRQLIAHGRAEDIALGFSTSGESVNVLHAFAEGHRRGMLTIGTCGYEGGSMARSDVVDHCLIVRSDSVHRIQEAQATLLFELWVMIQRFLVEEADHG